MVKYTYSRCLKYLLHCLTCVLECIFLYMMMMVLCNIWPVLSTCRNVKIGTWRFGYFFP